MAAASGGFPAACRRSARTAPRRDRRRPRPAVRRSTRISSAAVAEAGEDVGRDLAAAEHRHRGLERPEITLDRHLRLAGHDAGADALGDGFQMHAERVDAGIAHAREPDVVVRRLALALDRQIDRGFDADRALAQDLRAAIAAGRRACRHHHMRDAVEFDRGLRDFAELLRASCARWCGRPRATGRWRRTGRSWCGSDSGCRFAGWWSPARRGRAASRSWNRECRRRSSARRSAAATGI